MNLHDLSHKHGDTCSYWRTSYLYKDCPTPRSSFPSFSLGFKRSFGGGAAFLGGGWLGSISSPSPFANELRCSARSGEKYHLSRARPLNAYTREVIRCVFLGAGVKVGQAIYGNLRWWNGKEGTTCMLNVNMKGFIQLFMVLRAARVLKGLTIYVCEM